MVRINQELLHHLRNVRGANFLLSNSASARSMLLLCSRRSLHNSAGAEGRYSICTFAVACYFNGKRWLLSHDGGPLRAFSQDDHESVFRDVCQTTTFSFGEDSHDLQQLNFKALGSRVEELTVLMPWVSESSFAKVKKGANAAASRSPSADSIAL